MHALSLSILIKIDFTTITIFLLKGELCAKDCSRKYLRMSLGCGKVENLKGLLFLYREDENENIDQIHLCCFATCLELEGEFGSQSVGEAQITNLVDSLKFFRSDL